VFRNKGSIYKHKAQKRDKKNAEISYQGPRGEKKSREKKIAENFPQPPKKAATSYLSLVYSYLLITYVAFFLRRLLLALGSWQQAAAAAAAAGQQRQQRIVLLPRSAFKL
jgi:hypothetical protein